MVDKITRSYIRTENFITNLLMIGVVIFVFIAAVMRWVGYPIAWSVEFATLLFVWVIFLGSNKALRENRHIGVDFFTKRMPLKVRTVVDLIILFTMMFFLVFVGIFGIILSFENSVRLISNLTISYSWVTIAVPSGCLLMVITLIFKLKEKLLLFKHKG